MIEFVIPLKREDLLEASEDRYYVADIVAPELLSKKLEESAIQLKKNGGAFILEDFDTLYSSLIHFLELDWQDVHFMYDKIIMKSLTAAHEYSERSLEELMNSDGRKNDERIQALNILKMNIYILSQYFQAYNNKISQKTENVAVVKLKGRKRKTGNEDHIKEHSWDWEEKQKDGLVKLSLLLQLPLINFWDPPVVEETFSNTAAECCYRLLEQQSITLVKSRSIKTTLILILGILIKQYNHGLSFVVKSIQLMKRFDHVSSILAEAVTNYVNHFGCKSLIKHFLEEIVEASGDMLSSTSDQHVGKSFSNFLTDITESNPQDMEPFLEYIFPFLDSELPSLRMLGLSVMTAIFLGCLSSEDISTEAEVKRDKCLELLEDHIQDVNAFVRAKNLQMWQKIVSYGALPKDWLIRLMDSTIGILMDKSSIVTKQAIHLVKIMMESNPFAAKLSLQELLTTLEQEKMAYTELAAQDEANLLQKSMGEEFVWNEVEPELKQFLEDFFKEGGNAELSSSQDSPIVESPMKSTGARFTVINKYITEKNFAKAFKLLVHAEKTMPVLKELRKGIQLGNVEFYVQFFKKIFLEHQSALPLEKTAGTPIKQPPLTPSKRPPTRKLLELNDNATDQDAQAPTVLSAQKARVAFYSNCVEFAKRLSIAVERVTSLMKSKNVFEVVEAVEFIRMAKQFGVSGSEVGAIEMMKLIQCPEESIRTAATRALEVLYLQVEQDANPESAAKQVVKNLSSLVKDMKLSQKALLQILIGEWLKTNSLNEYCVATMLSVFLMEDPTATSEESYLALTLLSCVVTCQPKLVNENMENFFEKGIMRGLKSSQMKDLRVVASVCNILHSATSSHASKRFRNDHKMFTTLTKVIEENFLYFRENNYLLMVESALDLIFKLAMKPGALCHNIIKIVLTKAFGSRNNTSNVANSTGDISSVSINSNNLDSENVDPNVSGVSVLNSDKGYKRIHEEALARLVFILGHFALRLCFYFENDVLDERKKRLRKLQPDENKSGKNQKNDEDDELNMAVDVNAANDDSLAEEIQSLCENKILFGDGLLARNVKLPIHILQNEGKYSSRIVSIASAALGKFMLISRKFCRENIQMFVTILEKTADTSVKVNFIILFGELLPRFPNVIEPWISYVYLRLRDECKDVRLNTLYVLSHLITNELVKIKGQISDVALCIVDEEETIRDAAQRLFQELSTKGNTLYNLLTDIISTLSNPNAEKPLDEENFKKILRFLMDLVQKEKQMEHLVEKLSIRLRESQSERQWSDLAFCLSLLSYSDRSVRKLVDNFVCFKDKLHHPPVYSCLNGIISNANKSSKPGLKEAASELNSVIKEVLDTGSENWVQATPRNANGPNVRPSTTKRAVRGRSCKKKMDFSDSDSDSGAPRTRTKRTTKKTIQYDSSDESEDEPKAKTKRTAKKVIPDSDESEGEPKTKTKRTAKKHVIPDSDGESEDDIFVPPVASTRKCRKKIVL